MGILQEQAQKLQVEIDVKEAEYAELKAMFDAESKSIKDGIAVLKRVLRTTNSALEALEATPEDDE